jgi:hypothetical protein
MDELDTFRQLGRRVFGEEWISRLARAAGTNLRTVQRWAAGDRPIPPQVWSHLRDLEAHPGLSRLKLQLDQVVSKATSDGVDTEAMIAALRDAAERLRASRNEADQGLSQRSAH